MINKPARRPLEIAAFIRGRSPQYRVFSLTWPASMQMYGTKESVCIRKEFNSHRTGLAHQHGRRFIVLGQQYGRRDVM